MSCFQEEDDALYYGCIATVQFFFFEQTRKTQYLTGGKKRVKLWLKVIRCLQKACTDVETWLKGGWV